MKIFIVLTLFLAILIPQTLKGQTTNALKTAELPNARVIKVTGHPQYPPFVWKSLKTQKLTGVAVEVLMKAFAEIDVKVEFLAIDTWGRAQEEVKLGHIDILLPPYKNEERVKYYKYSENPVFMDETAVFVMEGKDFVFNSFEDLKKRSGVAIINDSFGSEFDQFDRTTLKMQRLKTTEQCFSFLSAGRADFVVAGINSGMNVVHKLKLQGKVKILPKRVIVSGLYAPISLKSKWNRPDIEMYLDNKMKEYRKNGVLKKLEDKYKKLMQDEALLEI